MELGGRGALVRHVLRRLADEPIPNIQRTPIVPDPVSVVSTDT